MIRIINEWYVGEPDSFNSDGKCYYDNPDDWECKHEYVKDRMVKSGWRCKGSSPWGSNWKNDSTGEVVVFNYFDDIDVIKEIIYVITI